MNEERGAASRWSITRFGCHAVHLPAVLRFTQAEIVRPEPLAPIVALDVALRYEVASPSKLASPSSEQGGAGSGGGDGSGGGGKGGGGGGDGE